jgi:alpha-ketoglutarate-dependent taurine dioxygenase
VRHILGSYLAIHSFFALGLPGFHVIHRDGKKPELNAFFSQKTTSCLWHQDVSYEMQPPGYVMLGLLDGPKISGDTVFAATDEAYRCVWTHLATSALKVFFSFRRLSPMERFT